MQQWNRRPAWRAEEGDAGDGRAPPDRRSRADRERRADRVDRRDPSDDAHATNVHRLLRDLGVLLQSALLAGREFGRVGGRVRNSVGDVADAVGEAWHVSREHGGSALARATEIVDRRPYVAIGLAAALGVIAGFAAQRGLGALVEPHDDGDGWDHFV
jgi:ElaB/YqjD/DUF883 family membrane-anchored ribosome-binding protein